MTAEVAVRVIVSGRVQGVGYRAWCLSQARQRQLHGWVRNLPDGAVEAWLQGPQERVLAQIEAMRQGPAAAVVSAVGQHDEQPVALTTFEVSE